MRYSSSLIVLSVALCIMMAGTTGSSINQQKSEYSKSNEKVDISIPGKVYISQEPHTLTSFSNDVLITITNLYDRPMTFDIGFGFKDDVVNPGMPAEIKTRTAEYSFNCKGSSETSKSDFKCIEPDGNKTKVVYEGSFDRQEGNTFFWHIEELVNEKLNREIKKHDYSVGDNFIWEFIESVSFESRETKKIEFEMNMLPKLGTSKGKYDICLKPNGMTIEDAINNRMFHCLDPWWNVSFNATVPISLTVANGETPTNFQVLLNVTSRTGMQADFDDVRFVNSANTTELSYWIEYNCSSYADIWIKVPGPITTAAYTIYMYYGNNDVVSTSSLADTFILSDDAETGTYNLNWTVATAGASGGTGSYTTEYAKRGTKSLEINYTGGASTGALMRRDISAYVGSDNQNVSFIYDLRASTAIDQGQHIDIRNQASTVDGSTGRSVLFGMNPQSDFDFYLYNFNTSAWYNTTIPRAAAWFKMQLDIYENNFTYYINNAHVLSYNYSTVTNRSYLGLGGSGGGIAYTEGFYDDIRIAKFYLPYPSASYGDTINYTFTGVEIDSPSNTTYYNDVYINLSVISSFNGGSYYYSLNGGSNISFTPNVSIFSPSGSNNVTVWLLNGSTWYTDTEYWTWGGYACNATYENDTICSGESMKYLMNCVEKAHDVYQWDNTNMTYCKHGCLNGVCLELKTMSEHKCQLNQTICVDAFNYITCYDNAGTYEWNTTKINCPSGCQDGFCLTVHSDCIAGESKCQGNVIIYCDDDNGDGIYEWSEPNRTICSYGCRERQTGTLKEGYCSSQSAGSFQSIRTLFVNFGRSFDFMFGDTPNIKLGIFMLISIIFGGMLGIKSNWKMGFAGFLGIMLLGFSIGWVQWYILILFTLLSGILFKYSGKKGDGG